MLAENCNSCWHTQKISELKEQCLLEKVRVEHEFGKMVGEVTQDYLLENPVMHCIGDHEVGSGLTLQNSQTESTVAAVKKKHQQEEALLRCVVDTHLA